MNDTLNNTMKSDFESNLNVAVKLSKDEFCYDEILVLLCSDKIFEKQIAVLRLEEIKSENDAELLVSNLVGQDGKIREAVAFKINELIKNANFTQFFLTEKNYEIFLRAIMDINGNVCRQIVELTQLEGFKNYLCKNLPKQITQIWDEIQQMDFVDAPQKKYEVSKRNFQLYWCLEVIYEIAEGIDIDKIRNIVLNCGEFYDYTIREKVAKILTKIDCAEFTELKEKLKNDENYYVRRYL